MAIDITATDNYGELSETDQGLVDTAVTAIKAAYTGAADTSQKDNVRAVLLEQVNSQEGT